MSVRTATVRTIGAIAAVSALYLATAAATGAGIVDDTYIFLRYARNIWEGAGPVFNDGERVEGYTSPLWLAVLTALFRSSLDPAAVAVAASAVAGYALLLAILFLSGGRKPYAPLLAAVFLSSNPSFVFWSWSGMDTALFALLVVLSALVFERDLELARPPLRTGLVLAAASAARLEGLWLFPAFLWMSLRHRERGAPATAIAALLLPSALILIPHALWRHAYYGAWLPNTFAAKLGVPRGTLLLEGVQYVLTAALAYAPCVLVLAFALQRIPADRRHELAVPAVLAGWSILYVVSAGGDHFALFRFLVPALALLAILTGRIAALLISGEPSLMVATSALLVGVNVFVTLGPSGSAGRSEVQQAAAWARTGRWCAQQLPPGTIASLVVGAIPYYCDRHTYDLLGLVDRHIATRGQVFPGAPAGHQKYDTDYILSRKPAYIFFLSSGMPARPLFRTVEERNQWLDEKGFALKELVTDPRTLAAYEYRAEQLGDGRWVELLERRR